MISAADPARQAQKRWKARELMMFPMLVSAMNEAIEPGSSYLDQCLDEIEEIENGNERVSEARDED